MSANRIRTKWGGVEVEVDSSTITLYKKNFPLLGKMIKYSSIPTDKIIYWTNEEDPKKSKYLYISEDGLYDTLPTSSNQAASDDKDDWLFTSLTPKDETKYPDSEGTVDELDADLYMYTSTTRLHLTNTDLVSLYSALQNAGSIKATVRKASGFFSKKYIAYTQKWLFHIDGTEVDSTPIREMAFFVQDKKQLYCGYHRQISAKINSKSLMSEIHDLCYSQAKRLKESGDTFKIGWFHPDYFMLTDSAIVYHRKTFRKDEMAYVPYRRINMLFVSSKLFKKRISIFGEQNIIPKHSLSRKFAKQFISRIKEHNVNIMANGKSYCSSRTCPLNWFGKAPRIVCMDDHIVYFPNRIKSKSKHLESSMLLYSDFSHVTWYKTPFSLRGTLVLAGIPSNIRKDQISRSVSMVIPDLCAFKYKWFIFNGGLRRILKKKTTAEFMRERKAYKI